MRVTAIALLLLLASEHAVSAERYRLGVDGLACPFCAYGIEKQLLRIEGVEALEVDLESGVVVMTVRDGAALDESRVRAAVEAAGFTLRSFEPARSRD